jgi:hypothetical protein
MRVATALVGRRIDGKTPLDDRQLKQLTRAAGVPQVWPRAWLLSGQHEPAAERTKLGRWLRRTPQGQRRCGIARGATKDGEPVVGAVVVRVVADLEPLPHRTSASRWLKLHATLHAAAQNANVVLLGPRGRPRRVLSSLSDGQLRSRFRLDKPGRWLIQVIADLDVGPLPVLEAVVFVESPPPAELLGDETAKHAHGRNASLLSMLHRVRKREGLRRLRHDSSLDRAALQHAKAMIRARRVAHDIGGGTPAERVAAQHIRATRVGENVARAPSVERVHAALWDSPSHRENMLDSGFARVGVAMVRDRRGRLWAVQLFAQ